VTIKKVYSSDSDSTDDEADTASSEEETYPFCIYLFILFYIIISFYLIYLPFLFPCFLFCIRWHLISEVTVVQERKRTHPNSICHKLSLSLIMMFPLL
jgi:hypothetical protein